MSTRLSYAFGFIIISFLLLTSVYLQIFQGVEPCPLCTLQRFTFGILGIWFLLGIFVSASRIGRGIINLLALLTSSLGILLAGRQIWLQVFPSANNSECGVSLQYMMQVLPVNEVIQKIFSGSAECSKRGWEFLSINMAEWALIWFGIFFVMSLVLLCKKK